jgi:actin related protein 2/3 complex subunit 1A/1B
VIAVAPNNSNEILVYDTGSSQDISKWKLVHVLDDHSQQVSGLDWNQTTNQIISCGYDKTAFVYTFSGVKWKPNLVIIQNQNRAALCVTWNASGTKFALGSGNKRIFIGYYEPKNNWWTCPSYKVHKSSVVAVRFHPAKCLLASASTDRKIIISSCFLDEIDPKEAKLTENVNLIPTVK